jgi:glycosyltransferase involved in cell wall biosynthesis
MKDAPLRVLHLRSSCGFYGAEQVILSLATHQPDLGVDPVIMDFRRPGDGEGPFLRAVAEQGRRAVPLHCRGRFDLRAVRALRELALSRRIDVFHGHDYKANCYGYLALRRLPVALVATNHLWDRRGIKLALYQRLDAHVMRRFNRIIAVASPVSESMVRRRIPASRITVIPNGLNTAVARSTSGSASLLQSLGVPKGRRVLGTVGRLEPQKGYDLLLKAMARLLTTRDRLHLVIIGEGTQRPVLAQLAERLDIASSVTFAGLRSDVSELLGLFTAFVSSSLSEGMPIAVLEAAAAQLPIVATNVGDVPRLVEDDVTGKLVPPNDVAALAAAIAHVLDDAELARRLGAAARSRLEERFSAREAARRTVEVYHQALSDVRGGAARIAVAP